MAQLCVRMSLEMRESLKELATRRDYSMEGFVRLVLQRELDQARTLAEIDEYRRWPGIDFDQVLSDLEAGDRLTEESERLEHERELVEIYGDDVGFAWV